MFIIAVLADISLLFLTGREMILLVREMPERFSNGDDNKIYLYLRNNHFFPFNAVIIDELPLQLQIRDFQIPVRLKAGEERTLSYSIRPTRRGMYEFGKTSVFISCTIGLICRRYIFNREPVSVPVYPSFLNVRKFEFLAVSNRLKEAGIKRVRKLGLHTEFDQIKEYVFGDDPRTINWKATAKKGKFMANQYQEERSQQIYNLIDLGRVMKMSFGQMTLLDYAINSSLVLANTALVKHDKAGLITFNTGISSFIQAERRNNTMARMMEALYRQETEFFESDFEILFITLKRKITHRSLFVLYSNFESMTSLCRQLPYLQRTARDHLLLLVIFENTEIIDFRKKEPHSIEEIYTQTMAEKFIHEKHLISKELNKHGILSLITSPQDLSVNLVNRYLEVKDRNLL